ncbi:thioester-forming surface-anchored protein [Corynebacterium diphtheriae bv. mitis]|uniref:thioester-forming surface-anchored protein n=1 Tax=Corynebacterium diphtheriae TaxID=1717 RepID=UPI00202BA9A3|nr:thioester-forming surface-anchored protein [Corynebacterium diphtheriae]MCM0095096.1 thioester-forming surface-anchored protein [Corynebacterium diphtheriae bv. mitis]MCM0097301.1 thioester-forming surface-anchored protein [Corynebacterium diphtheriae bv. mitis]MCM0099586.1 thioester-forming surface-anchored protein [Corynebacterium diphtheriae]MCM0101577.1 thioester-forming surface-anchored protein [Corynebacterium diphtheriae bv. mitis]MCM0103888.1 thioester-forming surface-anchored prote
MPNFVYVSLKEIKEYIMVKSVRLICILVVSLLLGASFVAPPYSYAADGDHSTNADTVEIWVKETPEFDFKNKNYSKEKEDKEKRGESTRKIYVEDPVAPGKKFVGYCFDLSKKFPALKGKGSDKFSKMVATENLFSEKIKGRTPLLKGSKLNEAILKIIWNGYGETPSGAMIDRAGIARKHKLTPDQFHNITQHAIWYYTDSAPTDLKESPENVQKALLALLGIETDPSVTLEDPPANMTLNFYLTSSPDTHQNVLGALPVDKETEKPLEESGNSSSTTTPSVVPEPPSTSTTTTTKPSETTSTEATSTKATSTESTTTEPTTTSTPAEPDNPQSPELGSSVGTYAIIGLPIAIGTIALIKAFTSTSSSSPQHTNPPVGSTAAAATPAKTTEVPPTQHAPQAKRQLAKTGASVLMVIAIALALVVAGLLLVRRRP